MSITFAPACETIEEFDRHRDAPSLNVSNHNAASILTRLGYDPADYYGDADADDFLGRVLTANIGQDDSGIPAADQSRYEQGDPYVSYAGARWHHGTEDECIKFAREINDAAGTVVASVEYEQKRVGPQMIDCGLRPGYFDDRMAALAEVANYCKDHGLAVQWC